MRRSLVFFLSLACAIWMGIEPLSAQKQQWRWQNPLPQGNRLQASVIPGQDVVIMVGEAGTIIKSIDNGLTWKNLKSNTRESLYAVSFLDDSTGFTVGSEGTILSTTDCGETWNRLISGRQDTLRGIFALDPNIIIAVGDTGTVIRSKDGGINWDYQPISGFSSNLNEVFFPGNGLGFIAGDSVPGFGGPPIVSTGDSGITWTPYGGGFPNLATKSLTGIWTPKADPNKAVLVGDEGLIMNTHDGGQTWNTPSSGTTVRLTDLWFFDDKNGFATGPNGVLLRTTNCGDSWSVVNSPIGGDLMTVRFRDSTTGFFGAEAGWIGKTTDQGGTWNPSSSGVYPNWQDITFLDDSFGVAVGNFGTVLRTTDAGENWIPRFIDPLFRPLEAVTRAENQPESRKLWAAGGTFGDSARIFFSCDEALTWTPQPIPSAVKLFGITFSDSLNGTAVGLDGAIWRTVNGGLSWQKKNSGSNNWLLSVSMPNDSVGYVVGGFGTILRTDNSGDTWTPQGSNTQEWLTSVSFLDDSTGMTAGNHGVVLRTFDAGNTWEDVSPPAFGLDLTSLSLFRDGRAANKTTVGKSFSVTAVGFNGNILYSADAGETWVEQDSRTNQNLWACYFVNPETGIAVGESGAVIRTDSITLEGSVSIHRDFDERSFSLDTNAPNPFREATQLRFQLEKSGHTHLSIWDMNGRQLTVLVDQKLAAGTYSETWTAPHLSRGIYLARLQVGKEIQTRRMILY